MGAKYSDETTWQGRGCCRPGGFLASEDAAYITGQTINVDGGLIMS